MFVKGYPQSKEHQEKAKKARREKGGVMNCIICGKETPKYVKKQETCGGKECLSANSRQRYHRYRDKDPIQYKANSISGSLRVGIGKAKIMRAMLSEALDKPCVYCGKKITLENASLDHKQPRLHSKVYNRKTKKRTYTNAELRALDDPSNLQIICVECNQLKNNFDDVEFKKFYAFMNDNPSITQKLKARLNRGTLMWKTWG